MLTRIRHLRRDERGMSFVYVGMGFMAFLAATTLAIDVGMFMTGRSQAQNSADAGALAGAVALAFNDFNDRSAGGPAVQSALNAARANVVIASQVSVGPGDVTFPNDPTGQPNRVKVDVFRTAGRGNPIPTIVGSLFGLQNVDIGATATAEASPANAVRCPAPFTIPDKWIEKQDPGGWSPNSTFDPGDVYIGPSDPVNYTGYDMNRDRGVQITLKADNDTKITASFYNPWDFPGSVGASDYRRNIAECDQRSGFVLPNGVQLTPENGNMVGPTKQGMQDLIDLDPYASWDTTCKCVVGSDPKYNGNSPRIRPIPVYDPIAFADGKAHGKNITLSEVTTIGFFIEPMKGGEVTGRIMPVHGVNDNNAGPAPPGSFPRLIRLVK